MNARGLTIFLAAAIAFDALVFATAGAWPLVVLYAIGIPLAISAGVWLHRYPHTQKGDI